MRNTLVDKYSIRKCNTYEDMLIRERQGTFIIITENDVINDQE